MDRGFRGDSSIPEYFYRDMDRRRRHSPRNPLAPFAFGISPDHFGPPLVRGQFVRFRRGQSFLALGRQPQSLDGGNRGKFSHAQDMGLPRGLGLGGAAFHTWTIPQQSRPCEWYLRRVELEPLSNSLRLLAGASPTHRKKWQASGASTGRAFRLHMQKACTRPNRSFRSWVGFSPSKANGARRWGHPSRRPCPRAASTAASISAASRRTVTSSSIRRTRRIP